MDEVKIGSKYDVEITGLTHDGSGVGRINERVVFVPQALPGDFISLRLVHLKKQIAYGEIVRIIQPSPDRVEPWCPYASVCGGCQLQHLNYNAQLDWKRQQVQDAMERIGKLNVEVLPTLGMEQPFEYRNKAQFPYGTTAGETVMGFFKKGTHDIVDLAECGIQHPLITKLALALKELVVELGIEPYNEKEHTGVLRHAVIRVSFSENKLMLILVTKSKEIPKEAELLAELTAKVPELVSISHNVNEAITNVILGKKTKVIWGASHLFERIGSLQYAISPGSFFQVNPPQTKVLYDLVKERMGLKGCETIIDLYCGAGTIGLYLAEDAKKVVGVETFPAAVKDASYNAELNGISNAQFIVGKAEDELPKIIEQHKQVDGVVLDPPRKGCEPSLLETLVNTAASKIVYVSCNPATLARDLGYLAQHNYSIGAIQPVDLFPWTRHVECVVLMSRVEK